MDRFWSGHFESTLSAYTILLMILFRRRWCTVSELDWSLLEVAEATKHEHGVEWEMSEGSLSRSGSVAQANTSMRLVKAAKEERRLREKEADHRAARLQRASALRRRPKPGVEKLPGASVREQAASPSLP